LRQLGHERLAGKVIANRQYLPIAIKAREEGNTKQRDINNRIEIPPHPKKFEWSHQKYCKEPPKSNYFNTIEGLSLCGTFETA